jgi:hypothetical protein
VTSADVFDLQLAATMLANDVSRIYTFNGGFCSLSRTRGISAVTPVSGTSRMSQQA